MKSVADLIANKNALIKRDNRGKITAASLSAAGVAVLAAAQAEAQGVDGFEDITSSVTSFERIGNGQVEFELENGQRFIANEGQYIIEGNQISVSQELVTIVGGSGINPTVIAVGVAGAALLVGALILLNSDDSSDSTATTTGSTTTTTNPGTTTNITSASTGEAVGTSGDDTFTVTDTSALNAITAINGGSGTDQVTLTEVLDPDTSPTLDLGSRGVTLTDVEQFAVSVDADTAAKTATLNMGGEAAAVTVTNTDSSEGTIAIDELGPSAAAGTSATLTLVDIEGGQGVDVDTDSGVSKLVVNIQNAGDSASDAMTLDIADSGEAITELTISSDGSSSNFLKITADADLDKLSVEGSENLNLADVIGAGDMSAVTEVDASGASGNIVASVNDTVATLTMGSGDDTITATAAPTAAAEWDGGAGSDTLDLDIHGSPTATISGFETVIASSGTVDFTNITDVDDLQVSGTVNLSNIGDGAIDDQITFENNADLTINSATETSLTLVGANGTGGNVTVDNGAAALTELIIQQEAGGTINLTGTNTKSLFVTGGEAVTLAGAGVAALTSVDVSEADTVTATTNAFNAIDSYVGSGDADTISVAGMADSANILTRGSDDTVTFTSAATDGQSATVSLGSGDDSVTLDNGMIAGSITLDGGAGADDYDLGSGGVAVTIELESLADLGSGFAVTGNIGTNILAAGTSGTLETVTDFTNGNHSIDVDGIYGAGNGSMDIYGDGSSTIGAADLTAAVNELDISNVYNSIFVNGDVNDYLLMENGGDVYVIEFTSGATGTIEATPSDDLFV